MFSIKIFRFSSYIDCFQNLPVLSYIIFCSGRVCFILKRQIVLFFPQSLSTSHTGRLRAFLCDLLVMTNIVFFGCENQVDNLPLVFLIAESQIQQFFLFFYHQVATAMIISQKFSKVNLLFFQSFLENLVANLSNYNPVSQQLFIHIYSVDFTILLVYWFLLHTISKFILFICCCFLAF